MNPNDIESMQRTQENLNQKMTLVKGQPATDPVQVAIDQLQLKVTSAQDKDDLKKMLQILQYPSTEIAQLHLAANRLGNRDQQQQGSNIKTRQQLAKSAIYCPCCSMVKQQYQLKLCHKLDDISNIGLSTFLYFQTIKNLSIVLVQMLLIYSIYALASNVNASGKFKACGTLINCSANLDYLAISLGSKQLNPTTENQTFYYVQCWLGVAMVIVWFLTFAILKYRQKVKQLEVDNQTRSASDFTMVIEGLPDSITQADFATQLKNYQEKIQKIPNLPAYKKKQLNIKKFNKGKPFFISEAELKDEELDKLQQENKQMKEQLAGWVLERQDSHSFSQTKEQMTQFYKKYEANIEAQKKRILQISQKMKQKIASGSSQQNPVYFVTLDSNIARSTIVELNPREFSQRVRNFITCASSANSFDIVHNGQPVSVKIERAPQPEDIIWANIGLTDTQRICRKIMTFTVTVIILGLSFLAVYGLSVAQRNNANNRFLSILISLVISLINIIITQSIRYLSIYERDYTTIKYQTSLAFKSILASLVNSILIPIVANRFIKNNIYDKNGLTDDIFMLGLTNAFVTPILKYIDGYYFYTKILQWIKCKPTSKLYSNQMELNQCMTGLDFEIGYQYVYVVHLYLFVCFFVSLQPIVCAFALVGYFIMYWAQKWSLFNRMRRPIPGNDLINTALGQLIFLGPIVYSLGSLTWSNFFPQGTPKYAIVPNLIALGISAFMFIFPLSLIFLACLKDKQQPEIKYDESRIFFPTEYERLNPSTAQEGLKDYMTYVQNYGKNMKGQSKQEQQKFANMLMKNAQRGPRPVGPQAMPFAPNNMMNFFAPPQQPSFAMTQQFMPGILPAPMQMAPMMGFQPSPMFMGPTFGSPFQSTFNPMVSGFMPQQPAFIQPNIIRQPPVQPFQPVVQPPRPFVQPQPQPTFIPPQQNVMGFGQPQNQFNPVGFQGVNQGPGFNQPIGFNQPLGYGQPSGFNQPPGFNPPYFQR